MSDEQGYPAGCAKCRDLEMQVRVYKREAVWHWERSKALEKAIDLLIEWLDDDWLSLPEGRAAMASAHAALERSK